MNMAEAYPVYAKARDLFNSYDDKGETEKAFRRRELTYMKALGKVAAAKIRTEADILAGYALATEDDIDSTILLRITSARAKVARKPARG